MKVVASVLFVALLAGCVSPSEEPTDEPDDSPAEPSWFAHDGLPRCQFSCYEPTVATSPDGAVYVTAATTDTIARSLDGTWSEVPWPPLPEGATATGRGDGTLVTDAQGRLWFLALVLGGQGTAVGAVLAFQGLQVARSDDGGDTWNTNTFIGATGDGGVFTQAERPWLLVDGDTAHVVYPRWPVSAATAVGYQGSPDGLWLVTSTDAGASFGSARRISAEGDDYGIPGRPILRDGALVVPYVAGSLTGATGGLRLALVTTADLQHITVTDNPGSRFPAIAQNGNDVWLAILRGQDIFVTTSTDLTTWSDLEQVNQAPSPRFPSPWLEADPAGGAWLAWSEGEAPGRPMLAHLGDGLLERHNLTMAGGTSSDFVHFTVDATGLWLPLVNDDASAVPVYHLASNA